MNGSLYTLVAATLLQEVKAQGGGDAKAATTESEPAAAADVPGGAEDQKAAPAAAAAPAPAAERGNGAANGTAKEAENEEGKVRRWASCVLLYV